MEHNKSGRILNCNKKRRTNTFEMFSKVLKFPRDFFLFLLNTRMVTIGLGDMWCISRTFLRLNEKAIRFCGVYKMVNESIFSGHMEV